MDIKTAVIYRLNDLINQKDITVNEAAVCSGVPPSTLKNILYGQSKECWRSYNKKDMRWIGCHNTGIFC